MTHIVRLHSWGGTTYCHDYEMSDGGIRTLSEDEAGALRRCAIGDRGNPHFCLGARCQITGVCDHNRRLDAHTMEKRS